MPFKILRVSVRFMINLIVSGRKFNYRTIVRKIDSKLKTKTTKI